MTYLSRLRAASDDAGQLEELYRQAQSRGEAEEFATAMHACYLESPGSLLYAAWHYRLQPPTPQAPTRSRAGYWALALPLSLVTGLLLWLLSGPSLTLPSRQPVLALVWAPIVALAVMAFLRLAVQKPLRPSLPIVVGMVALSVYAAAFHVWPVREQYQTLSLLHLPVLGWVAVGLDLVGLRSEQRERFAFVARSIEAFITIGLFAAAGMVFVGITFGLFQALGIVLSDAVIRLLGAGGGGAIPVLAVAAVYDPALSPVAQRAEQGLSRLISTLMRLLLPLSLVVLGVYSLAIPFNFMAPFRSRELLIVYNAMLFAVMALLVGATPVRQEEVPATYGGALRAGILALATLALLVSIYALSATVYRTLQGWLTPNRLTVIGWNVINIGILGLLLYRMARSGEQKWVAAVHGAIGNGAMAYMAWTVFLILALPLLVP